MHHKVRQIGYKQTFNFFCNGKRQITRKIRQIEQKQTFKIFSYYGKKQI